MGVSYNRLWKMLIDKNMKRIENCIREANKYVKEIRLFDVYEGGQIPEGKKSMAFTVTFAPKEEAFDFEKVQKFVEKICKKLDCTVDEMMEFTDDE